MKRSFTGLLATLAGLFVALSSPAHAQEKEFVFWGVQLEELEHRWGDEGEELAAWSGDAFVGTDEIKLRWLGDGEYDRRGSKFERLENRFVVQTPVSDFFDLKGGVRLDTPKGESRWYGVVGVTGLARQWVEIDADLFLSEEGDASARLDAEYDVRLTNRLALTPSADLDVAFSDDREMGVGRGFSSAEIGLRLGYDLIDRNVTPYIGAVWERKLGRTADFARDEGEDVETWFVGIGMRIMF